MIGKPTHQLFRSGRVVPLALDVQEQRDTEFRRRIHMSRQNLECLGAVEEGVSARPDRAFGTAE
jgi:hypothetical protein